MKNPNTIIVMPAYNAARTLERTIKDVPKDAVAEVILVDDHSTDNTVSLARKLGITTYEHPNNLGYGGNQKTCYWEALQRNPDVVVMIHPDYQYDASLIPELVRPILQGRYDMMFGSRIRLRKEALQGGMPTHKYFFNRLWTILVNILIGYNFSEYMSGMRAYSRKTLKTVPFQRFSNDFVFDQQMTFSALSFGLRIGEIPIPVRYYEDSSSISFLPGLKYGLQSSLVLLRFLLHRSGLLESQEFSHDFLKGQRKPE